MGAYLSVPVTDKDSLDASTPLLTYGVSEMQGWRRSMEDAHVAACDLPQGWSLFAVFDGHGGTEVSKFCARYLPKEIVDLAAYRQGDMTTAMVEVFHKMDDMLRTPQFYEEVKKLRNKQDIQEEEEDEVPEEGAAGGQDMARADLFHKLLTLKRLMDNGGQNAVEEENPVCRLPEHDIQAGCTAVVCALSEKHIVVANAGDSRAVLCRAGEAIALSADHKPNQDRERNRIVAAGGVVTDMHGQFRVNGNLNLSRAIGDLKYKSIKNLPAKDQIITAEPDVITHERSAEDEFVVLACDGVWDCMTNQQCVDFCRKRLTPGRKSSEVVEELLDFCLAKDPKEAQGIGCDNMTCIIVQFNNPPPP
mmetsp:Transcript_27925/g.61107  ORF Transcript_27925/g.61107 Transcript_27925/m.61107 type:complete len:362 (-) Transcript_27925:1228-2313(-)